MLESPKWPGANLLLAWVIGVEGLSWESHNFPNRVQDQRKFAVRQSRRITLKNQFDSWKVETHLDLFRTSTLVPVRKLPLNTLVLTVSVFLWAKMNFTSYNMESSSSLTAPTVSPLWRKQSFQSYKDRREFESCWIIIQSNHNEREEMKGLESNLYRLLKAFCSKSVIMHLIIQR